MRKDVRFGLTIGAILLAVLVVYVLVVPGDDPTPEQVSLETIDTTAAPVDPNHIEPSVLDTPVAADDTPVAPQDMAIIPGGPARSDAIASTSTPERVMAPSGQWDWDRILDSGNMLVATSERRGDDHAANAPAANAQTIRSETLAPASHTPTAPVETDRSTAAPAGATTYTVQPGESFSIIAQKLYGDARYYTAIEKANPGVDSRRLKVGQTLNVPERQGVVRESAIQAAAQQGGVDETPVDASRQYRVEANDSLYKIAQKLYGDGSRWQELHETNRQAIGENPANLKVGQLLALPAAPTQSAAR